jgi:hypothetical protein
MGNQASLPQPRWPRMLIGSVLLWRAALRIEWSRVGSRLDHDNYGRRVPWPARSDEQPCARCDQ